jgi:hypothetical protein
MNEDLKRRAMEQIQKRVEMKPIDWAAVNAANKKATDDMFNRLNQNLSNLRFVKKKRSIFVIWAEKIKRWF